MENVEKIINKIEKGCESNAEWIQLQNEVLNSKLSETERQRLMDSGVTEMLAMICDGIVLADNQHNT